MARKLNDDNGSFRMPNSVMQGLVTTTPAGLNTLSAFQTTTLLGLMTLVDSKCPGREVATKPSQILEIIEVGKTVAHAVNQEWTTRSGESKRKRYPARRYSPRKMNQVNDALLELHGTMVTIQRHDPKTKKRLENRTVHILDMFGYRYRQNGSDLDVDDLPGDRKKVNVGTDERPVWKVCRTEEGSGFERPAAVLFRLNKELADELSGTRGTIGFTLIARRIFPLLREFHRNPAAIRLILLVLRQTHPRFVRKLGKLITDLGWDVSHPTRAMEQIKVVLERLRNANIVTESSVDREADWIEITTNRTWYEED